MYTYNSALCPDVARVPRWFEWVIPIIGLQDRDFSSDKCFGFNTLGGSLYLHKKITLKD